MHSTKMFIWQLLQLTLHTSVVLSTCSKGQHVTNIPPDGLTECKMCASGTYMDQDSHIYTTCYKCEEFPFDNCVEVKEECTVESNTKFKCKENVCYEDKQYNKSPCRLCDLCLVNPIDKYVGRNCSGSNNTVCCPYKNMDVEYVKNGNAVVPQCKNKTTTPGARARTTSPSTKNTPTNGIGEKGSSYAILIAIVILAAALM